MTVQNPIWRTLQSKISISHTAVTVTFYDSNFSLDSTAVFDIKLYAEISKSGMSQLPSIVMESTSHSQKACFISPMHSDKKVIWPIAIFLQGSACVIPEKSPMIIIMVQKYSNTYLCDCPKSNMADFAIQNLNKPYSCNSNVL